MTKSKSYKRFLKALPVVGLILIIGGLYWYGATIQLVQVNTNMHWTDQSAYMDHARRMYDTNYSFIGDRNRMPIYPFFQSLFLHKGISDEALFWQGKQFNLILSLGILAVLAFIFRRTFSGLHALNLTLITAFTVFIFKAGYFQAELLFYFANFCLFLLLWGVLQKMSWKLAILTGIVAGLAYLTKASTLPALAIFSLFAGGKWGWSVLRNRQSSAKMTGRTTFMPLFSLLLVLIFFILTVFPYIHSSKRVFGQYFYNVNSTFYIWYDSWDEARQGTRAHGDRVGWPDMPAEEIPSLSKYLREHTKQEIVARFVNGGQSVINKVIHSYGYFKYGVIYLCLLLIAVLLSWRQVSQAILKDPFLYLFLLFYFVVYLLLYFWYAPIVDNNRLILAQFIPAMFTLSYGLHKLWRTAPIKIGGYETDRLTLLNAIILFVVLIDIYFVLTVRVGTIYGGS